MYSSIGVQHGDYGNMERLGTSPRGSGNCFARYMVRGIAQAIFRIWEDWVLGDCGG